jgi:hypothetical protein
VGGFGSSVLRDPAVCQLWALGEQDLEGFPGTV